MLEPFLQYHLDEFEVMDMAAWSDKYGLIVRLCNLVNITEAMNRMCENPECSIGFYFIVKWKTKVDELERLAKNDSERFILDIDVPPQPKVDTPLNPLECLEAMDNLLELTW